MLIKNHFLLLIVAILISSSERLEAQAFNNIYEEVYRSLVIYLTEDDHYYYSIGYAENIGAPELGFGLRTIDKKTGEVVRFLYHTIPNSWMFHGRCKKVVHHGTKMYFVYKVFDTIYIYEYDKATYELSVLDTIVHTDSPVFTWDIQHINNKMLVTYEYLDQNDSIQAKIYEIDQFGNKKTFDIKTREETIQLAGLIRELSPGRLVATGNWSNKDANNLKMRIVIMVMDTSYNVISEWWTPIQDNAFTVADVIILNEDEILAMLQVRTYDYIFESGAFPHFVYRINLKDRKVLWKKNFTLPESRYTTSLGALAKGHQEDTYFMCSSTYAKDIKKLDSIVTVGRVVKFRGNGNVIWQRDYMFTKEGIQLENNFNNMIATTDGHYLLGGESVNNGASKSWLVKINEEGHIIGDTTSYLQWEKEDWKSLITIYPNPVSDVLYINQEDIMDLDYSLTDMTGKEVARYTGQGAFQSTVWDISHLAIGSYILSIKKEGVLMGSKTIIKIR
jgi:TATA-box binding protein (TBP) (component of TFIID and TFIIIB)